MQFPLTLPANTTNHIQQVCVRCVMDVSDRDIVFGSDGVCNHCREATVALAAVRLPPEESRAKLQHMAEKIRASRGTKPYDSVVGLSGGVDSSYTAWLAAKLGLRPLAVHFDNGWNSEIAVSNIRGVAEHCGLELVTFVIDWPEFRDLQRAFIKAGVIDIEMLTDHAIMAAMYKLAREDGLHYVLSGTNVATEHGMPRSWVWNKQDLTNILDIHRRFGELPLKSYPRMGLLRSILNRHVGLGFTFVELLDLANYNKTQALDVLKRECGWVYYGGKHYESVFTKFYQAYILPTKFGVDKRRVHFSALVRNGEMSRDAALAELEKPLYPPDELLQEKEYVLKKLGFTESEFDRLMAQPPVPHDYYRSDLRWRRAAKAVGRLLRLAR
jgi:N-acetyl sugar amidotransferase